MTGIDLRSSTLFSDNEKVYKTTTQNMKFRIWSIPRSQPKHAQTLQTINSSSQKIILTEHRILKYVHMQKELRVTGSRIIRLQYIPNIDIYIISTKDLHLCPDSFNCTIAAIQVSSRNISVQQQTALSDCQCQHSILEAQPSKFHRSVSI
jgi:hypothetical protein